MRPSHIDVWVAGMDRAPYTVGKTLRILHTVLELARRDGAIRTDPAGDVRAPRQAPERIGQALTDEHIAAVTAAANEVDPRNAAMVMVMATMGLRVGEAMALRRSDVDLPAGMLRVAHRTDPCCGGGSVASVSEVVSGGQDG